MHPISFQYRLQLSLKIFAAAVFIALLNAVFQTFQFSFKYGQAQRRANTQHKIFIQR